MLKNQYTVLPAEALKAGQPLVYAEPLSISIGIKVTPTLKKEAQDEIARDPQRYQVKRHGKGQVASEGEVMRTALQVFLRLRDSDPALFLSLRDSIS